MFRRRNRAIVSLAICIGIALAIDFAWAQSSTMPGVENSVGYLSSGTSIEPRVTSESAPMVHGDLGNWTFMFHANVFLGTVQQTGPKGADKSFSTNWMMPMLTRRFGRQTITFRTMLSLEPATITKRQYPLLFQTGESAYGLSILNGQHPHDLFMEISGKYEVQLGERSQMFVYGGPISEAALGPAAFPHRASASENPLPTWDTISRIPHTSRQTSSRSESPTARSNWRRPRFTGASPTRTVGTSTAANPTRLLRG